jgi:tetracycline repressor-like protein
MSELGGDEGSCLVVEEVDDAPPAAGGVAPATPTCGRCAPQHPIASRVISDVVAEARRSSELADALIARYRDPRREAGLAMLRRAVERGELPPDVDAELALDLLAGPLYLRAVFASDPLDATYPQRLADAFLRAVQAQS